MSPRSKAVTRVPSTLRSPDEIGREPITEIVRSDDLEIPEWQIAMLDRALADGHSDGPDGRKAYRIDDVPQAVEVFLPSDTQIYVRVGEPRGNKGHFHEVWKGVAMLRSTKFNGYLLACPVRLPISQDTYDKIELACGREHHDASGAAAEGDSISKDIERIELRTLDGMVIIDLSGSGSPRKCRFVKYAGTWLSAGPIPRPRNRPEPSTLNYNANLKLY